ncbi:MAG: alanine racemase [Gemmatimonadota bacterium]|nr:alanine racemase [Gemmatimonadota bacterium]
MAVPDPDRVETPVGYVDLVRARSNARAVADYGAEHGLAWRPHIKTHKSLELARLELDAGAHGLTVATPREAEVMASLTDDLLLAYPPVGEEKLERVVRLALRADLKVVLDSEAVLRPLSAAAAAAGARVGVLVEVDVGLGRVGVGTAAEVLALARRAATLPGVAFRGVAFYPGHIRGPRADQGEALARVSALVTQIVETLREADLAPEIVSGGSTPTLWRSHEIAGLTEIRSGSCIFFDREGLAVGVASADDLAYTVLTTVVSTSVPGRAIVDAGSKALAKEERGGDEGYGIVLEHPEVSVRGLSEEHGILGVAESTWTPEVGERIRIVPNHVCVSVNLQDRLLGTEEGRHRWVSLEARGRGPWNG